MVIFSFLLLYLLSIEEVKLRSKRVIFKYKILFLKDLSSPLKMSIFRYLNSKQHIDEKTKCVLDISVKYE